jgi:putative endonuclease
MKAYYIYILKCSDGTSYTGITNNIERRLIEHEEGINPDSYTFKRRPVELQFYESFTEVKQAIGFEKKIKKWSAQKKKALIEANWDKLKELAECRNETHHQITGFKKVVSE